MESEERQKHTARHQIVAQIYCRKKRCIYRTRQTYIDWFKDALRRRQRHRNKLGVRNAQKRNTEVDWTSQVRQPDRQRETEKRHRDREIQWETARDRERHREQREKENKQADTWTVGETERIEPKSLKRGEGTCSIKNLQRNSFAKQKEKIGRASCRERV